MTDNCVISCRHQADHNSMSKATYGSVRQLKNKIKSQSKVRLRIYEKIKSPRFKPLLYQNREKNIKTKYV